MQKQTDFKPETHNTQVGNMAMDTKDLGQTKSVGAMLGEHLTKDANIPLDDIMKQITGYYKSARDYVAENPKEATVLAVSVGLAAWVLLTTKPGRQLFDKGAGFIPQLSKWMHNNFSSLGQNA